MLRHRFFDCIYLSFIVIYGLRASIASGAEVTPQHFGAVTDDGVDDSYAIQQAIDALKVGDSLFFPSGEYAVSEPLYATQLENSRFYGEEGSQLTKTAAFSGEYLLQIRFSKGITVDHLVFKGLTTDLKAIVWGEQGVFLGSTQDAVVRDNRFQDFGDACLRVTTADEPPVGVHSYDALVEGNAFLNCNQVTTTQVNKAYGATQNITFQWNYFEGLKGSLKLCTRAPVAGGIIRNNLMLNNKKHAIEVCSYSDVQIVGNYIKNTQDYAVNYYENRNFEWNGHLIKNNVIENGGYGFGFWAVMPESTYGPVKNTKIMDNCFLSVGSGDVSKSIIRLTSNHPDFSYDDVSVQRNQFHNMKSQTMVTIISSATGVAQSDNQEVRQTCVPWGISYLGTAKQWLRFHNRSFYQSLWNAAVDRLSL